MLQALRDKMTGWIAIVIVILLAIPFAFFGMEQYLFQSGPNYAAKVESPPSWWRGAPDLWPVRKLFWDEEEVSPDDFRTAFEQERQQRRQQQGDGFDALAFETLESRREVLESLVDQAVLRLAARNRGVAVGDLQVRQQIEQIPAFQVDGRFDPQRYQLALQSQVPARSPQQFQELIRESLQQSLMPSQIAQSAFVTPTEVDRLLVLLGERRDVSFVMLPPPEPDTGPVSDDEIQAWYQAHAADYRAPETVAIEYIEIDGSQLQVDEEVDEAALRERYEQERSRFAQAEQRLASHILIEVPADADAAAQQAAKEQAEKLAEQARAEGADFAALAREHSDDVGSSDAGGDLGWVEPGMMVEAFEQALFAMEPGEVRGPVRTEFGWHVLQLREVKGGEETPFEEVRDQLATELAETERERAFSELLGRVVDQAYRSPNSLEPAAAEGGLTVRTVGPFARGEGSGIAAEPAMQRAAFSESLIEDGTVSDPIEIGPNHNVLIRVSSHTPERALPLAEVRERVIEAIRTDRADKRAQADADALVAEVAAGAGLDAVAAKRELPVQDVPAVPRGAPIPHPDAVEAYFAAEPPEEGKATAGKVALDDGSIVVFAVTAVTPGDPEEASAQERELLQQQLATLSGNEAAAALLRALRADMKITVVEAQL
ncbi:peptidyl-prolyl cis-trans isomerase [Luteimonas suaedae]|uniref:peptidyl-prolyl cis-trans isomerase n=1 Tax=Luteimonas suaedae TaxID=2605430 RepID=UPI0011EBCA11|nr:peptidyl-prolyl cis-trans isomerase [Luteimonas suaedae]